MNPLQIRLASLRRRMIVVNFWRGSCTLFAVVVGMVIVAGLSDRWLHLPAPLRALCLVGTLAAFGTVFVRFLYLPLTKRLDDLSLALRIEEIYPELNDNLASAVQFLEDDEANLQGSKIMRKQAIEHALQRADHCDFSNIIDRRGMLFPPAAALLVGVCAAFFIFYHWSFTCLAMTRLADPFGAHFWTQIDVADPPVHVAQGQPFTVKGRLSGIKVEKGRIDIQESTVKNLETGAKSEDGSAPYDKILYVEKDATGQFFQMPLELSAETTRFRFRIQANDGVYPTHGGWTNWVEVKTPPQLIPINKQQNSPQIDLDFPLYTDLPTPKRLIPSLTQASVEAVAGTKVLWQARVDRAIVKAWLELPEVKQPIPCTIGGDRKDMLSVEFTPKPTAAPGAATIFFEDELGLSNSSKIELNIFIDPAPTLQLKKPTWSVEKMLPTAQITLDLVVLDRIFAVRSVYLEYRRKNSNGVDWADKDWHIVPIIHSDLIGAFGMLGQSYQGAFVPMHIRPDLLEFTTAWQLRGLFKEGDIVTFRVCADDYNDLTKPRQVGRTRDVDIVIVGKREFTQELDAEFEKVQKQIVKLQEAQEEAAKLVKEVMDKKGDPDAQRRKLLEAEQKQAGIKEIIGNPRDGLRKSLDEIKERMAENKLPASKLQDNVKTISKELEKLNRVNLPQIENNLANAQRQIGKDEAAPEKKQEPDPKSDPKQKQGDMGDKAEPKKKDPLEQAKSLQDDTSKTLGDLARFLDPWATQQQIKDRIIKLTAQQKELKKDTEALTKTKPIAKSDLDPRANRQDGLAVDADKLLSTITEVLKKQEKTEFGEKLAETKKIAEKAELPVSMREVSRQLRDTDKDKSKLNDSVQKQGKIIANLEKMLASLDDPPREEQIEGLTKKNKKAQKEVDELRNDMAKLDQEINKARKIENAQERENRLKELAPEQKRLEDKARELSRELARLQADKASRDLENAAKEMELAGDKLKKGQDPEGDGQKQIKQELDQAKADLKDLEEELAREQLALIADRLKGIKEREDALIAETERIHSSLTVKKQWTTALQISSKDSGVSQGNLAKDAELVLEKLKQSPVFEYTLKKAKAYMDKAAAAIVEHTDGKVAGEPLDKDQLEQENKDKEKIVKLQRNASDQLDRLIVALKEDLQKKPAPKPKDDPNKKEPDMKDPKQPKPMPPTGDGIPQSAEIKVLIQEQLDIRKNTKEFNDRCPDRTVLTDEQKEELRALEVDQTRFGELFNRMMSKNKEKGEEP